MSKTIRVNCDTCGIIIKERTEEHYTAVMYVVKPKTGESHPFKDLHWCKECCKNE